MPSSLFFRFVSIYLVVFCQIEAAEPLVLFAKKITFNVNKNIISAVGQVTIEQKTKSGLRKLFCEKLTYTQKTKRIYAEGKVKLTEPDGHTSFAEKLELSENLREGTINALKIITKDNARFLAKRSERKENGHTKLEDVSYTPCKMCKTKPTPTWELESDEVTHNPETQMVSYKNVYFKILDTTVFYFPYFSHPEPKVKRKSGFLFPTVGGNTDLGIYIMQPYHHIISKNHDVTFYPMVMSRQHPMAMLEHRYAYTKGVSVSSASITTTKNPKKNFNKVPSRTRWHLTNGTEVHISETQRLNIQLNRASDLTYRGRYKIDNAGYFHREKTLTSSFLYEYFSGRTYADVSAYSYQNDASGTTPLILPKAEFIHAFRPIQGVFGSFEWRGSLLNISRHEVPREKSTRDTQRISTQMSLAGQNIHELTGLLFEHNIITRIDGYLTRGYGQMPMRRLENSSGYTSRSAFRFFPQASFKASYPLLGMFLTKPLTVKPFFMLIASPTPIEHGLIPNDDSLIFTYDDTSLMLPNRYLGTIDKVDWGPRVVYGLDSSISISDNAYIDWLFGTSKQLNNELYVPQNIGVGPRYSDWVNRIRLQLYENLTLHWKTLFMQKCLKTRYSEIGARYSYSFLELEGGHVFARDSFTQDKQPISQISWKVGVKLNNQWKMHFAQIKNLRKVDDGSLSTFAGISYKDDCSELSLSLFKNTYQDRDLRPETGFMIKFSLKNLGSFTPFSAPSYQGSILSNDSPYTYKS